MCRRHSLSLYSSHFNMRNVALDLRADTLEHNTMSTYPCQLSFEQLSLGFVPLASRQARDAALGANTSETLAAPGTLEVKDA